jgi:hypothetical protein
MTAYASRISRLERAQLEAAIGGAKSVYDMTDHELWRLILEDRSIAPTDDALALHMRHFDLTGELPSGAHIPATTRVARKGGN